MEQNMARPVLDKLYDPRKVEDKWYAYWMEHRLFHADPSGSSGKYTVMIPPPNVTGMLTMGHILNNTLQDLLVRWKRMEGKEALWMPGMDHAGIATQNKVEAALKSEGKTRHDLGREKLIERVWQWKETCGGIILKQLRKLGASCDWERERFTMDEGLSRAVREVFIRLYEKKWITRGRRLINWCPRCHTALADEEASATEVNGKFWHIAYPLEDGSGHVVVSTTRPETMLGDAAVAVHPEDPRYRHLVGKTVTLPLMQRRIPIIADEHADPEKGSGAVKITPAHDFDDFEVGQRHGLPQISVMDETGRMNENAGPYKGLDRFEARKKILADLEALSLLKGEEARLTPIPHCYRCDTVVEPFLSDQWFVKMKPLAEPALRAVREGKVRFHPKHWEETYFHWMENIRDWCISRQIWWGHRIPVYTCANGHEFVSRHEPSSCPQCASTSLAQDSDVLDTWFSSWLWPFSTLGWPDATLDLKAFFPTNTLVTGPDIIFFWVARMIMASLEFMGDVPFSDVYFNGMIRDLSGRKMSKSLGNSPDPLWLIEGADAATVKDFAAKNPSYKAGVPPYGADAIRMTMVYLTPLGGDIHFDHTLVEMGQKFSNKLWNASRFVLMNLDEEVPPIESVPPESLDLTDRWILSRLSSVTADVRSGFEQFRFNDAAHAMYDFVWGEFCDWYIEMAKPRLYEKENRDVRRVAQAVVLHVLDSVLRLLHPVMPFITEEIWQALPVLRSARKKAGDGAMTIMVQNFPSAVKKAVDEKAEKDVAFLQKAVSAVRNIRSEMNVPPEKKAKAVLRGPEKRVKFLLNQGVHFARLAGVESLEAAGKKAKPKDSATAVVDDVEIFIPLEGLIDLRKERERIGKEIERLEGLLGVVSVKLMQHDFVQKAPKDVVDKERKKQADFEEKAEKLRASLKALK
jgi:valyl-tRNA synthetase